jgi:hypothetical protein
LLRAINIGVLNQTFGISDVADDVNLRLLEIELQNPL